MPRRKSRPPRTENRFRQREIARSIRGAEDAGKDVERVEIDPATGRIHLILAKGENSDAPVGAKAWDDALTKLQKEDKPEKAPRSAPARR
jgi:hypothetical protein